MVNPDLIRAVKRNGITTPNKLRVEVSDGDVLDDDILRSATEAETFAFDRTRAADADDSLIRSDIDRGSGSLVPSSLDRWRGPAAGLDDLLT